MQEVVGFIHNWLGAYPSARDGISTQSLVQSTSYLLSLRRTELRKKVDGFREQLIADLAIEIRVAQELDDLVRALGENITAKNAQCVLGC